MPEPRHVVFLATDFRPMPGGIAEYLHNLAHYLGRHVPVTVMTSVPQDGASWERAYQLIQLPQLPERRLGRRFGDGVPPARKLHTGLYFLALSAYAGRVAGLVKRTGDRTMAVIGSWDTSSHFWCDACRRRAIPYALAAHGLEVVLPFYGRLPEWRREDFARADRVFANSGATADLAATRLGLAVRPAVVHPAVGSRPPEEEIRARAAALRGEWKLPAGPVLFSLGRLVRRKGFDLVLRAVGELLAEGRSLSYVIAGDGPEHAALQAIAADLGIADRVRVVGLVDELTKWAAYSVCDVFVMPNRLLGGLDWEGFGIVFLEAALAGRPTIGGSTGGTADAIANETTGLLVNPERPGALTQAIRRLVDDEGLRRRLGQAGQERVRQSYLADAAARQLVEQLGWH